MLVGGVGFVNGCWFCIVELTLIPRSPATVLEERQGLGTLQIPFPVCCANSGARTLR